MVGRLSVPAVPLHQVQVRLVARGAAALVRGRDAVPAPAGGELLLVAVRVCAGEALRGPPDGEAQQEAVDDDAAGGEVRAVGLHPDALGGRDMAEAEVEDRVGERPGPGGRFGEPIGVDVQGGGGADADEALARGVLAVLLTADVELHGGQRRVEPHQPHALGEGLRRAVPLLRPVAAHRRASTSRGMSRAASTRNQEGSTGLPSASEAMTVWATSTEISASCTSSDLAR